MEFLVNFLSASIQVVGPIAIPPVVLFIVLVFGAFLLEMYVHHLVVKKGITKDHLSEKTLKLCLISVFVLALSLGGYMEVVLGEMPTPTVLYNPLFSVIPLYVAYRLQVEVNRQENLK